MSGQTKQVDQAFALAKERYAELGVDIERALARLAAIPISLHCWQGDDVGGFENAGGRARRRPGRHRQLSRQGPHARRAARPTSTRRSALIPGKHRFNLHAIYAETGGKRVERNELEPEHFSGWIDWAQSKGIGLDFNPTFFAHPKAADGFTLAHRDAGHPPVLDRARHRLPQDRRGHRPAPGHALRHQRLDPRRLQGRAHRPQGPARAAGRVARRDLRRADRPGAQPRRRREQAVRHRLGELRRRLARVLPGLRRRADRSCSASTPATSIPPRRSPTRSRPC